MGKTSIVKIISASGGTTTPASFPKLEEKADPMLSELPPWAEEGSSRTADHENASIFPEKNSKIPANSCEIENKLLDGKSPATGLEKLKLCLSSLLTRKQKNAVSSAEKKETSEKPHSYIKCEKFKNNLLTRKRKEKHMKRKKTFVKIWLTDLKGHSLKMYTFRKED